MKSSRTFEQATVEQSTAEQADSDKAGVVQHSVLAMRAAKKMGRSRQKVKTGRTVCHHLLQMISETDGRQPDPRASRRFHRDASGSAVSGVQLTGSTLTETGSPDLFSGDLFSQYSRFQGYPVASVDSSVSQLEVETAANDQQYSLAF